MVLNMHRHNGPKHAFYSVLFFVNVATDIQQVLSVQYNL